MRVKVTPPPPTWEKAGTWTKELKKVSLCPHPQGNIFIPMCSLVPAYQLKYMLRFQFLFGENVSNPFSCQFFLLPYINYHKSETKRNINQASFKNFSSMKILGLNIYMKFLKKTLKTQKQVYNKVTLNDSTSSF